MKTQREIRFRAWCNINKRFLKDFEYPNGHSGLFLRILTGEMVDIQLTGNEDGYSDISYDFFNPEFYDIELQQFTGLKDKNGVDIYEGDIIDISNGEKFIVYWDNKYDFCFKKSDTNTGYRKTYRGATRDDGWIIIGNIYENHELIKN